MIAFGFVSLVFIAFMAALIDWALIALKFRQIAHFASTAAAAFFVIFVAVAMSVRGLFSIADAFVYCASYPLLNAYFKGEFLNVLRGLKASHLGEKALFDRWIASMAERSQEAPAAVKNEVAVYYALALMTVAAILLTLS